MVNGEMLNEIALDRMLAVPERQEFTPMAIIEVGAEAPDIAAKTGSGAEFRLSGHK